MSRTRVCSGISCVGSYLDITSCYGNETCKVSQSTWFDWSVWSNCSVSCGLGTMSRNRECSGISCIGSSVDIISCYGNKSCTVQCDVLSKTEEYVNVPANILQNTMFHIVFLLQNIELSCNDTSTLNIDTLALPFQFELDFGDNTSRVVYGNTSKGHTFSHSFKECRNYTIKYLIKSCGKVGSFIIIDFLNVTVFCVMSPIKMVTDLTSNPNQNFVLPLKKEFTFSINQDYGSYIKYLVDWGDNIVQVIDQSQNINPISFVLSHTYTNAGNYTAILEANNALQFTSIKFVVQIQNCSFPSITFQYGSKKNPLKILNTDNDFVASVDESDNVCLPSNVSFIWMLTGGNTTTKSQGVLANNKIVYSLKPYLDFGSYVLSLLFTYNMVTTIYVSYFMIVNLPLYIEISNGAFRTVASKQGIDNVSQNFTINAFVSSGGLPKIDYQGLVYKWKCRVADASFVLNSLNSNNMVNSTFEFNTCFNDSWTDINVNAPVLVFNTKMFIEGVVYQFQVVATNLVGKYLQSNSFIQEIMFSSGELPDGQINCITNCAAKLNTKDKVVYMFSSLSIVGLSFIWEVFNDDGEWPEELLHQNSTTTGFSESYLVINSDILLISKNYTFMLTVGYVGSPYKASFKIIKQTSSVPIPGNCFVSPQLGYAIITKFKLVCQDWSDNENSVLRYEFFYDSGKENYTMTRNGYIGYPLLNAKSLNNPMLFDFVLGPGNLDKNFTVSIYVRVIGIYKSYTQYPDLFVQVLPFPNNVLNELAIVGIPDTQISSSFLYGISNVLNDKSNSVKMLNAKTNNNITGFNDANDEIVLDKQNLLVQMQSVRTQVVQLLSSVPLNSLTDVEDVSDVLAIILTEPDELTPQTMTNAVDIIANMSSLLTEENIKDIGPYLYDQITQPFLVSVSHLFIAIANSDDNMESVKGLNTTLLPDYTLLPGYLPKQVQNKSQIILKLFKSIDDYLNGLQYYIANNEDPIIGDTPAFKFFVKKVYGAYSGNISSISSDKNNDEQSGFSIFNLTSLLNESIKYSTVVIKNLNIRNQIFTWDLEHAKNIASESQILYLSTTTGQKIEVKNVSSTISISIKNIPQKIIGRNISLSMPYDAQMTWLDLPFVKCKLMMKFTPLNDPLNKTSLIVYIQYGKAPTIKDYDIKLNISTRDGTDLILGNNTPYSNLSLNIQRSQKCQLLKDGSIMLWDFHNSTYSFLNKTFLFLSYFYDGPMPEKILESNPYTFDEKEFYGTFLYEMKSFCVECNYWNESNNKWMSDGCELDVFTTSFHFTKCKCTHLTAFSGFFIAPNALVKPSLALLKTGYVLLATVSVVILLWIIGLVWSRRMDKHDTSKVGVCPLLDNHPGDHYLYQIKVVTGNQRCSGTKSNIFLIITGDNNDSGVRHLKDSERGCFQRSSCDIFIMATHSSLGDLNYIRLWHDNSGGGWYLNDIVITDLQTNKQSLFIGHRWIAVDHGECTLDYVIPVASAEECRSFNYIFTSKVEHNLTDEHLWLSIFTRPPRSNFTRCQRLSVAVSLLLTSMMVSTMFYGKEEENPIAENKSVFSFSKTQIFVVLISTVIKFPVHLLFLKFFRSIRPNNDTANNSNNESPFYENRIVPEFNPLSKRKSVYLILNASTISINEDKPSLRIKKKASLPHWCLNVAWFFCVGNIFFCIVIILLYGMRFGNKTSLNWLASISIDFAKETLLSEPIKIFILAIFVAVVVKEVNEEECEVESQGKKLAHNEHWLYKPKSELSIYDMASNKMQPIDSLTLKKMKQLRFKKLKMSTLTQQICFYIFYAALVLFIGYLTHENVVHHQNYNVQNLFNLKLRGVPLERDHNKIYGKIKSSQDFWPWMEEYFLPQVFPKPWYHLSEYSTNVNTKDFSGKIFLNDLNSKIVNGIRIRQLRVQPNSCIKARSVAEFFKIDCLSSYNPTVEETQDFDFNWTSPIKYKSVISPFTMSWRYQTSQELDGYSYETDLDTYYGGGYAVEIFPKWNNIAILNHLKELRWIDRQTRAIIIEFALFNAATNYFTMTTLALEFPASGGVVPSFTVHTFKLYLSVTGSKAVLIAHVIFVLMTILFTVREFRLLYRTGFKYFVEFWNLIEFVLIIFSIVAIGLFFYKEHLAKALLQQMTAKKPEIFINFQFASYWDLTYVNIVALIVFFVTLKFINLLRFNQRVLMLSSTLKAAWYPLNMFGIMFFIILCSVVTTSSIVFGPLLEGYQNYFKAIGSIVSLLLGKFSYSHFESVNSVLGIIFFFGFNCIVLWIIMNIFVAILNDAFSVVREDLQNKANEYEMVDFVMEHLKDLIGWRASKKVGTPKQNHDVQRSNDGPPIHLNRKSIIKKSQSIDFNKGSGQFFESNNSISNRISKLSKYDHLLKEREFDINEYNLLEKFGYCMNLVYKSHNRKFTNENTIEEHRFQKLNKKFYINL